MKKLTINEIIELWKSDKKLYVKKSTYAAYVLLIENHISPYFGGLIDINEDDVQSFVLEKIKKGLSQKTIKDIIIVLKMI